MKRLVGERRAIAAAVLAFYTLLYALFAMSEEAPEELVPAMIGLASVYGLAFFGLTAGYFWARWYAIGVGLFGVISGLVAVWQLGMLNPILFMLGTHAFVALGLWGDGMSNVFDGQEAWRNRFHMDEHAVNRLGKAVIRIGVSLPYILLYALVPRMASESVLALAALGFAGAGAYGLVKMRTWGLAALVGATALLAVGSVTTTSSVPEASYAGAIGAVLLAAAVAPFVRPVANYLRGA